MTVILDEAGMRDLLESERGPVGQHLGRVAFAIETQAKINATGGPVLEGTYGRGPRVRTDRLRSSITWVYAHDAIGIFVVIGTNVVYGRYLERGLRNGARYPFLHPALVTVLGSSAAAPPPSVF